MQSPDVEQAVRRRLREAVQAHAADCRHSEISGGDSVTLVHHDPNWIIKVMRRIMEDLFEGEGHPVMRVAIDYGAVSLSLSPGSMGVMSGAPFRVAARLEPHVTPNEIWVTDAFKAALENSPSLYQAVALEGDEQGAELWRDGQLNIRKQASREPDQWIRVFRLEDRSVR